MTLISTPFSAIELLNIKGKVDSRLNLEEHAQAFRNFYEKYGLEYWAYDSFTWDEFIGLQEAMSYHAHYFHLDPDTDQWMLEVECGRQPWVPADPNDYFNFLGS